MARRLIAVLLVAILLGETPGASCFAAIGEIKGKATGKLVKPLEVTNLSVNLAIPLQSSPVEIAPEAARSIGETTLSLDAGLSAPTVARDAASERALDSAPSPAALVSLPDSPSGIVNADRMSADASLKDAPASIDGALARERRPLIARRIDQLRNLFTSRTTDAPGPGRSSTGWVRAAAVAGMIGVSALSPATGHAQTVNAPTVASPVAISDPYVQDGDLRIAVRVAPGSHALADTIRVEVVVTNTSSFPQPVHSPREALGRAVAGYFKIAEGPTGEALLQAGASVPFSFELRTITIPSQLEAEKGYTVHVQGGGFSNGSSEFKLPSFNIDLRSVVPAKVQGLKTTVPDGPYEWSTGILAGWIAMFASIFGGIIWLLYRIFRKPPAPDYIPALAEDEVFVELRDLRTAVKEGKIEQEEFYERLNVVLVNSLGPRYGLNLSKESDLRTSSATLRQLSHKIASLEDRLWIEVVKDLNAINGDNEFALYAMVKVDPSTMLRNLDSAEKLYKRYKQLRNLSKTHRERLGHIGSGRSTTMMSFLPIPLFLDFDWSSFAIGRPIIGLVLLAGWLYMSFRLFRSRAVDALPAPNSRWIIKRRTIEQWVQSSWKGIFLAATLSGIISVTEPAWGYHQLKRMVSSLDSFFVVDTSGSMAGTAKGSWLSKIKVVIRGGRYLVNKQRGTTNRIGVISMTNRGQLLQTLTIDFDAVDQAISQLDAGGGTELAAGVNTAINNFLETNIIDADPDVFPAAKKVKQILKDDGLDAALEEAAKDPKLLEVILAKDRPKLIYLFTDGDSNTKSLDRPAAERAKALGFVIASVGVPDSDGSGYDANALNMFASVTKVNLPKDLQDIQTFFPATDAASLDQAFQSIERLQKAMVKTYGMPRPIQRDKEFAQLAWWLLVLSLGLKARAWRIVTVNPLRRNAAVPVLAATITASAMMMPTQQAHAFVVDFDSLAQAQYHPTLPPHPRPMPLPAPHGMSGAPSFGPIGALNSQRTVAQNAQIVPNGIAPIVEPSTDQLKGEKAHFSLRDLLPYREIPEIREANQLYRDGKFAEAEQRYNQAIKNDPDFILARIYRGKALLKQKKFDEARAALEQALKQAQDAKRPDLIALAELELGSVAADADRIDEAMDHFHQATRQTAASGSSHAELLQSVQEIARWNYEQLMRQKAEEEQAQAKKKKLPGVGEGSAQNAPIESQAHGAGEPKADAQPKDEKHDQGQPGQQQPDANKDEGQSGQQEPDAKKNQGQPTQTKGLPGQAGVNEEPQVVPPIPPDVQQALKDLAEDARRERNRGFGGRLDRKGTAWALLGGIPLLGALVAPHDAHAAGLSDIVSHGSEWLPKLNWDIWHNLDFSWLLHLHDVWWTDLSWFFWTVPAVAVLALLLYRHIAVGFAAARRYAPRLVPPKLNQWLAGRKKIRETFFALLALVFFGLAASGPVKGTKDESFNFGSRDIAIGLGVGWGEVLAVPPDAPRVEVTPEQKLKGKMTKPKAYFDDETDEVERFIHWLENGSAVDRIAVIPYAGEPKAGVGLTYDYRNLIISLYRLKQDAFALKEGSDVTAVVDKMIETFEGATDAGSRPRVGIIIGRGGNLTVADAKKLAAVARKYNVTLYTIGVGSTQGSLMYIPEKWRQSFVPTKSGYIEENGQPAKVYVNEPALRALAEGTGGIFAFADKGQGVDTIIAQFAAHAKRTQMDQVAVQDSLARGFSFLGVISLLLSAWSGTRRRASLVAAGARKLWNVTGGALWRLRGKGRNAPLLSFAPVSIAATYGPEPVYFGAVIMLALAAAAFWLTWPTKTPPVAVDAHGVGSGEVQRRFKKIKLAAQMIRAPQRMGGEFLSTLVARSGGDRADSEPSTTDGRHLYDYRKSARLNRDMFKRKEQQPDLDMMIVLHATPRDSFGSTKTTKREVKADLVAAMALAAQAEDIPVGLTIVSGGRVVKRFEPMRGTDQVEKMLRTAMNFEAKGTDEALGPALEYITKRLPAQSLVTVVSDFDRPDYADAFRKMRRANHFVFPMIVRDVLEAKPVGDDLDELNLEDASGAHRAAMDLSRRSLQRRLTAGNDLFSAETDGLIRSVGLRPMDFTNDGRHLNRLVDYFTRGRK